MRRDLTIVIIYFSRPFFSPNVNVTRLFWNPLVKMEIGWTDEMANDFRKYLSEVETLIPTCWLKNLTSVAVRFY